MGFVFPRHTIQTKEIPLCLGRVGELKHPPGETDLHGVGFFYTRFRQRRIRLCLNRAGKLKTFPLGNQAAGHPFSSESEKWGSVPHERFRQRGIFLRLSRADQLKTFPGETNLPGSRSLLSP